MNVLPEQLPVVDEKLKQLKILKRGAAPTETDFDTLVVNQASSISSALNSAGVLEGTELRVLAQQVANIDVLFGEVEGDELVRLVFVEDKLFRNPESGRKVLAQILEYANKDISADEVIAKASPEVRKWLTTHRESLERLLLSGDFLLMICGDRINPRLLEIAKPMLDRRALTLRGVELVLMSLAIYEGEGTSIVVPNLVGAVTNFERDLRIEVTVRTEEGRAPPATVEIEERDSDSFRAVPVRRPAKQPWTEERFLEATRTNAMEHKWPDGDWAGSYAAILRRCEATPGLVVRWAPSHYKGGYFNIEVKHPTGDVKVAWANIWYAVGVYSESIGDLIGADLAKKRVEDLARRLKVGLNGSGEATELGDLENYPDFRNEKSRDVLFDWLVELREEILKVSR